MDWVWLLAGLFIGMVAMALFDWLYWRNTRVCSEMEADLQATIGQLENQNLSLTSDVNRLNAQGARVSKLEADLDARTAQYNGLLADVDQRKKREDALTGRLQAREDEIKVARTLRTRLQELESQIGERDAELAKMRTSYESRGAQLSGLTGKIGDLEAQLGQRDGEITRLSAELSTQSDTLSTLGAAAAGGAVGYMSADDASRLQADLDARDAEVLELRARLGAMEAERDAEAVAQETPAAVAPATMRVSAESTSPPASVISNEPSDLGMIWGVNSEINSQLNASGVHNYQQLANSRAADIDEALTTAQRYYPGMDKQAIHGSWIKQSDYAEAGEWDALSSYQHETIDLASGRDDLKVIWGIGPKIEGVMNENGVYTFAQVASVPAERLTEILHKAGPRFRMSSGKLHETWPEQARLADKGDLDALATLQSGLSNRA